MSSRLQLIDWEIAMMKIMKNFASYLKKIVDKLNDNSRLGENLQRAKKNSFFSKSVLSVDEKLE